MKKKPAVKTIQKSLGGIIRFFLLLPALLNLIGNYVGLTHQYTFYSFGFNAVTLLSRYIENNIVDITWRTIALVLVTFITSFIVFVLLRQTRKGKHGIFIFLFVLYALDSALVYTNGYLENASAMSITTFIHYFTLLTVGVLGLFYAFISPIKRGYYDHA